MTSDKGWSFEYANDLTYRQIMTWWERYWARRAFDVQVAVKLNPFGGSGKDEGGKTIDLSEDDNAFTLAKGLGLPIKSM